MLNASVPLLPFAVMNDYIKIKHPSTLSNFSAMYERSLKADSVNLACILKSFKSDCNKQQHQNL